MTNGINKLEYVDVDLNKLSDDKIEIFEQFKLLLDEKKENNDLLYLYRGDMLNNLKIVFKESYKEDIFQELFYFGTKSRFTYSKTINNEKEEVFSNINDCSERVLDKIFDDLLQVVQSSKFATRYIKNENHETKPHKYIDDNFKKYFENSDNKDVFKEIFTNLVTLEEKVLLRDYFLYLLHTSATMQGDTILVSTTTKKSVAKKFTRRRENDKRIIFHYFIFEPYFCHTITPWKMEELHKWIEGLALPLYCPMGLYPQQKEVSIKGGLYPQNILGIELVDEKKFIVNPNLFHFGVDEMEFLIKYKKIPIDQERFLERINNETYHSDSIWTHDNFCGLTVSIESK